jgi:hypothetical protein
MTRENLRSFSRAAVANREALFGDPATIDGVQCTLAVSNAQGLALAAGGFEADGELKARVADTVAVPYHSRVSVIGRNYKVIEINRNLGFTEFVLTLEPIV